MDMYHYARLVIRLVALWFCVPFAAAFGEGRNPSSEPPGTGEQIFKSACAACHGADGRGTPKEIAGFAKPRTFPDFTACDQTTPEPNTSWKDIITHGGKARGFSEIMPSFGDALSSEQIDEVIQYVRGLCRNPRWVRGELNLPRALVTEKAFPEDEVVITTAVNARGAPGVMNNIVYEQRFGMRNQFEADVPVIAQDLNHTWYGGVGDVTLAAKRVLFSSLRTGSIMSVQGGVLLPTGNRARGFGTGTTTFETFASFNQLFPTNTFVQIKFGGDLPRHTDIAPQSIFFQTALGQSFAANHGLGRPWSPMFEVLAAHNLVDNAKTDWDVLPQMQVTISKRQHIRANLGVRVPVTNTTGRPVQVLFYLLWDWFDGRLNEGWR